MAIKIGLLERVNLEVATLVYQQLKVANLSYINLGVGTLTYIDPKFTSVYLDPASGNQIIREIAQSCSLFQWEDVLVRDVPMKDELVRGITLIQSNQLIRPRWEIRLRHYWAG